MSHDCKTDDRKLPIDRPCSACSGGDTEMKFHAHCPPFRGVPSEPSGDMPNEISLPRHVMWEELKRLRSLVAASPEPSNQRIATFVALRLTDAVLGHSIGSRRDELAGDILRLMNESSPEPSGAATERVRKLESALRGLMNLTDQGREGGMILSRYDHKPITNGDQDIIDRAYIAAESALASAPTEAPTPTISLETGQPQDELKWMTCPRCHQEVGGHHCYESVLNEGGATGQDALADRAEYWLLGQFNAGRTFGIAAIAVLIAKFCEASLPSREPKEEGK